jgi:hypothetical protein
MMHGPMNVKSPNNTSKWQMGFNLVFKGLTVYVVWETRAKRGLNVDVMKFSVHFMKNKKVYIII